MSEIIDNRRTSISGEILTGRGTTTQQAFQIETGYGLSKDGARFTPFVRYEMIRAKLKPFEESGGMDALAISGQKVRSNTFGLGAVAEYAISTSNGVWIPSGRVEFLSERQKQRPDRGGREGQTAIERERERERESERKQEEPC